MKRLFIIFLLLNVFSNAVHSQDDVEVNVVGYKFLDYQSGNLPKDLLTSKSVVFVSVPTVSKTSSERGDWKRFSKEAHVIFKQLGIDPVKYYYMDDVLSGLEVTNAIAEEMKKREISNILVISHVTLQINNKDAERYVIVVTPFSGDNDFMKNGQAAWKNQDKSFDKVLKALGKNTGKLGAAENLLVNDTPEFFESIEFIKGRRNQSFSEDLRVDKLAIPKFDEITIPQNPPGGVLNNVIKKEAENYNTLVGGLNSKLDNIFKKYPYEYGFIDSKMDDKALRAQGYDYILLRLNTSGESIKILLGYELDDIMDDYVTVKQTQDGKTIFRSIPKTAPVYKYYIKHIYSGDIYLGTGWDADEFWFEALENHLDNLLKTIEKK